MPRLKVPLLSGLLMLVLFHCTPILAQWEPLSGIRGRETERIVSSGPALYAFYKPDLPRTTECLRSLDSGKTWVAIKGLEDFYDLGSTYQTGFYAHDSLIVIFPATGGNPVRVYTSHDFGEHFSVVNIYHSDSDYFYPNSAGFGEGKIYLAGGGHHGRKDVAITLLSSTDLGASWQVDPATVSTTDMLWTTYEFGGYLFSTTSNTLYRRNLATLALDTMRLYQESSSLPDRTMTYDGKYLYIGETNVTLRSTDAGAHWDSVHIGSGFYRVGSYYFYGSMTARDSATKGVLPHVQSPFFHYWNQLASYTAQGKYGIVATNGGIYRCTVGKEDWTLLDTALSSRRLVKIYSLSGGLYAFSESGLHVSTDRGSTWRHLPTPAGIDWETSSTSATMLSGTPTNLWFLSTYTGMWHSTNNGNSWSAIASPNKATEQGIVSIGTTTLMGHLDGVQRSTDAGKSWTYILKHDYLDYPLIDAGSVVYAPHRNSGSEFSTDLGSTWLSGGDPVKNDNGNIIAADGSNIIGQFSGQSGRDSVFRSTNKGVTWTRAGKTNGSSQALALRGKRAAMARINSIDTSGDLGTTWKTVADTLPSSVLSMTITDNYLYATTLSDGAFRLSTKGFASVDDGRDLSAPLIVRSTGKGRLRVSFAVGDQLDRIHLYDIDGRELSASVSSSSDSWLELDIREVMPGPYFLSLTRNGQPETQHIIIE